MLVAARMFDDRASSPILACVQGRVGISPISESHVCMAYPSFDISFNTVWVPNSSKTSTVLGVSIANGNE